MTFFSFMLRNLLRRRFRTGLTVIGLSVGIAAVVALLGIAWGFEQSFLRVYQTKGIDLVVVRAGVTNRLTSNLDESLADRLKRVPGVKKIARSLVETVSFDEQNLVGVIVNGWEADSLLLGGIRMRQGRPLGVKDDRAVMLGRVLAISLGKRVGDDLEVAGERFRVVGVYEADTPFENGALIMPLKTLQWMMGRQGRVTAFVIAVDHPEDRFAIEKTRRRIEREFSGVAVENARDYVEQDIQIRLAKTTAWATTLVALALGSIGLLNTMAMSVFERTREIGILRALGWKPKRVIGLILGESLAMGLAGAILGTSLGVLGVAALAKVPSASGFINTRLPYAALASGPIMGVGLTILGGIYPAIRAARLNPIEAIRYE